MKKVFLRALVWEMIDPEPDGTVSNRLPQLLLGLSGSTKHMFCQKLPVGRLKRSIENKSASKIIIVSIDSTTGRGMQEN